MRKLILSALIAFSLNGIAQSDYSLKESEPRTGTHILHNAAHGFRYPLDKRFEDFNAAEREALKAAYEPMPEGDEPPFPRDGLKRLIMDVLDAATRRQATGRLYIVAHVNSEGTVDAVDIHASPDDQLGRFAAVKLGQMPFKPAICDGRPCRMDFPFAMMIRREYR